MSNMKFPKKTCLVKKKLQKIMTRIAAEFFFIDLKSRKRLNQLPVQPESFQTIQILKKIREIGPIQSSPIPCQLILELQTTA